MHQEEQINDLFTHWKQEHTQPWPNMVKERQQKIETTKGKIRIRDQALEMEFEEQNCAPTTPLPEKEHENKPDLSLFAHLKGGMLLTIPPAAAGGDTGSLARPEAAARTKQPEQTPNQLQKEHTLWEPQQNG